MARKKASPITEEEEDNISKIVDKPIKIVNHNVMLPRSKSRYNPS